VAAHTARIVQILIVDDHPGVRTLIRELLAECLAAPDGRVAFHECENGEAAVASLADASPDLITVDLRMPGMHGLECVRHLRQRLPLACIVVVTQFGNEALQDRARIAGADSVVCKDDIHGLQDVTRKYLKRR
jgi:two-component system response regulator (stage 0 sporulation protein F)